MNPDGSEQVNLTQHPATDQGAVWSPAGDQILFVSDRQGTRVRDLYVMDADGSNVRRVFEKKTQGWRHRPTWSIDAKQFAYNYTDWDRVKYGLYLGTFGKEDAESLPYGSSPVWSPDGSEIACSVSRQFGARLTFMDVDTRDQKQPLPDKVLLWQYTPSWSAAGDRLVIAGNRHPIPVIAELDLENARALHKAWKDKQTIFMVNRDGTGLQQLVDEAGEEAWAPEISPNGEQVLYTQQTNGENQIFNLDVNSGVRTQLTHISRNFGGDWFDPAYTLPVSPQPHLLTTTWGDVKKQ